MLIEQIEILPYFYGRILIPQVVWEELQSPNTPEIVRIWIAQPPPWLEKRRLVGEPDESLNYLDQGEREAIALAEELHADRLIADETLARQEALRRQIPVIGTLGILRNAALAGLLSLPESLTKLQRTSFYVAPELIRSLLKEDEERLKKSQ